MISELSPLEISIVYVCVCVITVLSMKMTYKLNLITEKTFIFLKRESRRFYEDPSTNKQSRNM